MIFKKLLLLILINSCIIAQEASYFRNGGFPLITNYLPKKYSADGQNWGVLQDKRGIMYFGNSDGLLEYDGVTWRLIKVPNNVVRSLEIDQDGRIFVGGINEIGYLAPDSTNLLQYRSLKKYISKDDIKFGDVWRIIIREEGLYFQTFSSIFLLESRRDKYSSFLQNLLKNPSVKRWEARTRFNPMHSVSNRIFIHERNIGIQELINGKLTLIPGGGEFAQDLICIMLPYPSPSSGVILVGSLRRGMFLYDGKAFRKFVNEADDYLVNNRLYYRGALLKDGSYALGTQVGGIVVLDRSGKLKRIFTQEDGLNNNTIWDLFPDREGNLWAALDYGISRIVYPSDSDILNEKSGFEGSIHDIKKFNNRIYLATSSGIFYSNGPKDKYIFQAVKGASVQSWSLLQLGNSFYAATNDGIMHLVDNTADIIDVNLRYTYCFFQSVSDPAIIYAGLHNGLAILKLINNKLSVVGVVPDFQEGVMDIQEDSKGNLWLNDLAGNIIKFKIPINKTRLTDYKKESVYKSTLSENKIKMFRYGGDPYFYDTKEVLYCDRSDRLSRADRFNITVDSSEILINIYNAGDSSLWYVTNASGKTKVYELSSGKKKSYSFLEMLEDFIPDFTLLRFLSDGNQLWTTSGSILIIHNFRPDEEALKISARLPLIRKVSCGDGEVIYNGYGTSEVTYEIGHSKNSLVVEFASPSYLRESGNDYQYTLEGFNDSWSRWSNETRKEYTNLPPGDFTFKIRTRDLLGNVSPEASFRFTVLPPWYRTWWANLAGFLIILLLINYVIRFRVRYLENKNIILEKLVNERTAKINEQKEILEKQAQKLLELDQLKSNFFANISHEFRTPLTLIKGHLENVLKTVKDENIRHKINIAFNNSNRLNRLINQVLDISKIESGKLQLEFEPANIVSLVKARTASFETLAEQKEIIIKFTSGVNSLLLYIDKEKIEEVIDNLLSNAFKFTPAKGSISISVDEEKTETVHNAVIKICDTGTGIPEDKVNRIFDRFYQTDNSTIKAYEGSGLGLTIVKELVELHGGSIGVTSTLNSGTTFLVTLPVEETGITAAEDQAIGIVEKNENDNPLVMIVEDNNEVRSYIRENLEHSYRIEEAINGEDGIRKAMEKIPDLIITDVMMPKIDGLELCVRLKNDQKTSHIPIIILTARADDKDKIEGLKIGADEFLAKPFSPQELEIRVGNLIRIRQLLREKYKEISVIKTEDVKASPIDKQFLEKVFILIKDHLEDQQFSVQKLADEMSMSVSQINRKLNALINQSAGKLIRSTKLDYAARLLDKNAGNITEIGYRIGFSDLSSFTNSFKEKFGISPSEYLKNRK